jgi:hypothetical protein
MPVPPTTRDAIIQALRDCGPMTAVEIAQHLGVPRHRVESAIVTARKNWPGRYLRVIRYQQRTGVSGREAAVYSASRGPDAPRPVFDPRQGKRDYYQRNRTRLAVDRQRRRGAQANWLSGLVPLERRNHPPART